MQIQTSKITDMQREAENAKAYWQQPGTQTLEYRGRSHYAETILYFSRQYGARTILEFGCGAGRNLKQIHAGLCVEGATQPLYLRGIDTNQNSIQLGQEKFGASLDLLVGDETALTDEPDNFYDLTFTVSVLDHLPDPAPVLRAMLAKTKKYALFLEPSTELIKETSERVEFFLSKWSPSQDGVATPFTYFHNYSALFEEAQAKVLLKIPMPTSVYRLGPLYTLYIVEKSIPTGSSLSQNVSSLADALITQALLTLSDTLRSAQGDITRAQRATANHEKRAVQLENEQKKIAAVTKKRENAWLEERSVLEAGLDAAKKRENAWLEERSVLEAGLDAAKKRENAWLEEKSALEAGLDAAKKRENAWLEEKSMFEASLAAYENRHTVAEKVIADMTLELKGSMKELARATVLNDHLQDELTAKLSEHKKIKRYSEVTLEALRLENGNTYSNRVGRQLVTASASVAHMVQLPVNLFKFWRDTIKKSPPAALGGIQFTRVCDAFEAGGLDAVATLLTQENTSLPLQADAYSALARYLKKKNFAAAAQAARRAYQMDPWPYRRKFLAFRLYDAGEVLEAEALLAPLMGELPMSASEKCRAEEIFLEAEDERDMAVRDHISGLVEQASPNPTGKDVKTFDTDTLLAPGKLDSHYCALCRAKGPEVVIAEIRSAYVGRKQEGANRLIRISRMVRELDMPEAELPLLEAAQKLFNSPANVRSLFWGAQRAKQFKLACSAIQKYEKLIGPKPSEAEQERLDKMKASPAYQLSLLSLIKPRHPRVISTEPKRVCYVLHNTLPYSSGGYATRSHGVALGLKQADMEVIALSRPGFPLDIKADLRAEDVTLSEQIDGIRYMRLLTPSRKEKSALEYMTAAADALEVVFKELCPEIVVAASNHVTGMPALIAARRLGIPFCYEVRGLWEITRISREPEFQNTPAFTVQTLFEAALCQEADQVFTLTGQLRAELIARGANEATIDLLPNSCDPSRFMPQTKCQDLADTLGIPLSVPVIGYIGTFVIYEGLEDLASACALLKARGLEFRLLLVGSEDASGQGQGSLTEQIMQNATVGGFKDWLIMPGRIPHEDVEKYYSLIDIAPFPRKPWPVCEMVSPMKPLEALAMEKAVVVSSVEALREMITDGETGAHFNKGNTENLADVLEKLIKDPHLRATLGKNGRRWVEQERTWTQIGAKAAALIQKVVENSRQS